MWRGLALAILAAHSAQAQAPRSAIDWLSESLQEPPNFVISPPSHTSHAFYNTPIISMPLEKLSLDAVGLLPPDVTGFPMSLWDGLPSTEAIKRLQDMPPRALPETASLFKQILLSQSNPPLENTDSGALLLARIDLLFAMGALDEAETLIVLAGADTPELFKRWFDIAVINNRTIAPCAALKAKPALSNDIATRVICLARSGDWNAAAITVSLGESLGQIAVTDADILVRFLDPEMFAELEEQAPPASLSPIIFTLRESLALPRPPTPLPLPLLNADMNLRAPARLRIMAAERLVKSAAIPPTLLFAAYRGARAASSGGAWGRAELVQALDAAFASDDDARLAAALTAAMEAFADADLLFAFAQEYADSLAHYQIGPETGRIAPALRRLLLLADRPLAQWAGIGAEDPSSVALASRLVSREDFSAVTPHANPLETAVELAFNNLTPPRQDLPDLLQSIDAGQFGKVLLTAISLLAQGQEADPQALHEGLYLLRKLGMDDAARRTAVQLLLLPPAAA
jgi:hypothetical protein